MNMEKSLLFLREYVQKHIKGYYQEEDDYGVRGLILLVQDRYKFHLGVKTKQDKEFVPLKLKDLRHSIEVCYRRDDFEEFAEKYYISDVLLKKPVDIEWYIKELEDYNLKLVEDYPLSLNDKYTITHIVWGLYMIVRENSMLRKYKEFLGRVLVNLYKTTTPSDIQTETLYFLSLIDKSQIREEWIINLERGQEKDGGFSGEGEVMRAHHTALALLTLYNYYNL